MIKALYNPKPEAMKKPHLNMRLLNHSIMSILQSTGSSSRFYTPIIKGVPMEVVMHMRSPVVKA